MDHPSDLGERCRSLIARGSLWIPSSITEVAMDGSPESIIRLHELADSLLNVIIRKYNAIVTIPRNVVVPDEIRIAAWPDVINERLGIYGLVLYTWFPFSIFRRDRKSEYEPLELVMIKRDDDYSLAYAYARVHYDLCEYNLSGLNRLNILYFFHGHTPFIDGVGYIRVRCPKVRSSSRNIGRKYWDRMWLGSAKVFLKATRPVKLPLELLVRAGVLKIMECPDGSLVNPFRVPYGPTNGASSL